MKKLYAESIMDNRVVRPKPNADEYETTWELTEISPNRYEITVWNGAHRRILANPSFIEGADKQIMGNVSVEVAESGVAEMNADGKLIVTKKPKINLWDRYIEKQKQPPKSEQTTQQQTSKQIEVFENATVKVAAKSGKKLYAESIMDNRVVRPRSAPDEYETVWELTEISPNRYEITAWNGAHRRILANPAFLDGAEKQVMGNVSVEVAESGIAEMNADGKLVVTKKPRINLWDREITKTGNIHVNQFER